MIYVKLFIFFLLTSNFRLSLDKLESVHNGGVLWMIRAKPALVTTTFRGKTPQRTFKVKELSPSNKWKPKWNPRFVEIKDKQSDSLYGNQYCKTLNFDGFDRSSNAFMMPKKEIPLLIEWDSEAEYEVDGLTLSHPRDWTVSNLSTTIGGGDSEEDGVSKDYDDNNKFVDIASQMTIPYVLHPSPKRKIMRTISFDTPLSMSMLTLNDDNNFSMTKSSNILKKVRYDV